MKGLCKLGVLGGADASVKSMAEGSTVILMKACRRLLLGESANEEAVNKVRNDANTRWAIDGLAYLSLTGEVKEALIKDEALLKAVYKVAEVRSTYFFYFRLASTKQLFIRGTHQALL